MFYFHTVLKLFYCFIETFVRFYELLLLITATRSFFRFLSSARILRPILLIIRSLRMAFKQQQIGLFVRRTAKRLSQKSLSSDHYCTRYNKHKRTALSDKEHRNCLKIMSHCCHSFLRWS